jgi:hypothetical protein
MWSRDSRAGFALASFKAATASAAQCAALICTDSRPHTTFRESALVRKSGGRVRHRRRGTPHRRCGENCRQHGEGFSQSGISAYELATKYAIAGDFKKAGLWFARSYKREFLPFLLPSDKLVPATFQGSPQYKALLNRPLFQDWQPAHDQLASDLAAR